MDWSKEKKVQKTKRRHSMLPQEREERKIPRRNGDAARFYRKAAYWDSWIQKKNNLMIAEMKVVVPKNPGRIL